MLVVWCKIIPLMLNAHPHRSPRDPHPEQRDHPRKLPDRSQPWVQVVRAVVHPPRAVTTCQI